MPKDTERKMIDEVADIIQKTIFATRSDNTDGDPALCRQAAVLVINHLADSYDEMENPEPTKE